MIKTMLKIFALMVLSYALFVTATIPANVAWYQANVSPQQVQLYDIKGTVYRGTAGTLVTPQITLSKTAWDWRPSRLLGLDLGYLIETQTANGKLDAKISVGIPHLISGNVHSFDAQDIRGSVPLSDLPLPPVARSVPLQADILINLDSLSVVRQFPSAAEGNVILGSIEFKNGEEIVQLGSIYADISTQESGEIVADISSDGEIVDLAAVAKLQPDGRWSVDGTLDLSNALPAVLFPVFGAMGKRQPDGSYLISHNGQITKPMPNDHGDNDK